MFASEGAEPDLDLRVGEPVTYVQVSSETKGHGGRSRTVYYSPITDSLFAPSALLPSVGCSHGAPLRAAIIVRACGAAFRRHAGWAVPARSPTRPPIHYSRPVRSSRWSDAPLAHRSRLALLYAPVALRSGATQACGELSPAAGRPCLGPWRASGGGGAGEN